MIAAQYGSMIVLRHLVRLLKADVNIRAPCGCTAMHLAALTNKAYALHELASAGANINDQIRDVHDLLRSNDQQWVGATPAIFAAKNGHVEAFQILAKHGVDFSLTNQAGESAASIVQAGSRCEKIIKLSTPTTFNHSFPMSSKVIGANLTFDFALLQKRNAHFSWFDSQCPITIQDTAKGIVRLAIGINPQQVHFHSAIVIECDANTFTVDNRSYSNCFIQLQSNGIFIGFTNNIRIAEQYLQSQAGVGGHATQISTHNPTAQDRVYVGAVLKILWPKTGEHLSRAYSLLLRDPSTQTNCTYFCIDTLKTLDFELQTQSITAFLLQHQNYG